MRFRRDLGSEEALDDGADEGPDDSEVDQGRPDDQDPVDAAVVSRIELLYGYVIALELVAVSILNLVITTGKGAPKHPSTTLSIVGLVASVAFVGVLQLRKRTSTAFAAIIAAFFVTLPPVPERLSLYHLFALAIPAAYGLILAQRRRKGEKNRLRNAPSRAASRREGAAGRRPAATGSRRQPARGKRGAPQATGPQPNRRYTPPKPKRKTPGRT